MNDCPICGTQYTDDDPECPVCGGSLTNNPDEKKSSNPFLDDDDELVPDDAAARQPVECSEGQQERSEMGDSPADVPPPRKKRKKRRKAGEHRMENGVCTACGSDGGGLSHHGRVICPEADDLTKKQRDWFTRYQDVASGVPRIVSIVDLTTRTNDINSSKPKYQFHALNAWGRKRRKTKTFVRSEDHEWFAEAYVSALREELKLHERIGNDPPQPLARFKVVDKEGNRI